MHSKKTKMIQIVNKICEHQTSGRDLDWVCEFVVLVSKESDFRKESEISVSPFLALEELCGSYFSL